MITGSYRYDEDMVWVPKLLIMKLVDRQMKCKQKWIIV